MWRYAAICNNCGRASAWRRERQASREEILRHLQDSHGLGEPWEPADYQMVAERQCDYCLEQFIDRCTKCNRDFCAAHAGDINGLCGGCI